MTVIFTRQSSERTKQLRREFKEHNIAKHFLTYLLENGYLNRISGEFVPRKVLRGKVPKGFDIHHIRPLSGGGTNSLSNLCLIERSLHKFLNRRCFDPALRDIVEGETVEIDIPNLPPLALYRDYKKFIDQVLKTEKRETSFHRLLIAPLEKIPRFIGWRK